MSEMSLRMDLLTVVKILNERIQKLEDETLALSARVDKLEERMDYD